MKIGLISDTHDNQTAIQNAVNFFNKEKVDLVLHGGDHIAPFTIRWFGKLKMKMIGVKGNLDAEYSTLKRLYHENNWELYRYSAVLELANKKIILLHGEDENIINAILASGIYDIVIRGHLHKIINNWVNNTLHLSSGEACGYLYGERTVAILKLPEVAVEFIEI